MGIIKVRTYRSVKHDNVGFRVKTDQGYDHFTNKKNAEIVAKYCGGRVQKHKAAYAWVTI